MEKFWMFDDKNAYKGYMNLSLINKRKSKTKIEKGNICGY